MSAPSSGGSSDIHQIQELVILQCGLFLSVVIFEHSHSIALLAGQVVDILNGHLAYLSTCQVGMGIFYQSVPEPQFKAPHK